MKISVTICTLFNRSENIKNVLNFIKNTRICTRKWILGTVEDEEVHGGGWGDLEKAGRHPGYPRGLGRKRGIWGGRRGRVYSTLTRREIS